MLEKGTQASDNYCLVRDYAREVRKWASHLRSYQETEANKIIAKLGRLMGPYYW